MPHAPALQRLLDLAIAIACSLSESQDTKAGVASFSIAMRVPATPARDHLMAHRESMCVCDRLQP